MVSGAPVTLRGMAWAHRAGSAIRTSSSSGKEVSPTSSTGRVVTRATSPSSSQTQPRRRARVCKAPASPPRGMRPATSSVRAAISRGGGPPSSSHGHASVEVTPCGMGPSTMPSRRRRVGSGSRHASSTPRPRPRLLVPTASSTGRTVLGPLAPLLTRGASVRSVGGGVQGAATT